MYLLHIFPPHTVRKYLLGHFYLSAPVTGGIQLITLTAGLVWLFSPGPETGSLQAPCYAVYTALIERCACSNWEGRDGNTLNRRAAAMAAVTFRVRAHAAEPLALASRQRLRPHTGRQWPCEIAQMGAWPRPQHDATASGSAACALRFKVNGRPGSG